MSTLAAKRLIDRLEREHDRSATLADFVSVVRAVYVYLATSAGATSKYLSVEEAYLDTQSFQIGETVSTVTLCPK